MTLPISLTWLLSQCSSHWRHRQQLVLTYFDMKFQVFIHGIDIVEDVLHYPGDDAHCICVMEIPLQFEKKCINACIKLYEQSTLKLRINIKSNPYLHGVCFAR